VNRRIADVQPTRIACLKWPEVNIGHCFPVGHRVDSSGLVSGGDISIEDEGDNAVRPVVGGDKRSMSPGIKEVSRNNDVFFDKNVSRRDTINARVRQQAWIRCDLDSAPVILTGRKAGYAHINPAIEVEAEARGL